MAALCGCQQDDALDDAAFIAGWANSASALGVYTQGFEPLHVANGDSMYADPACPQVSDDGTTVTITGDGCMNTEGDEFFGSATIVRGDGALNLTMTGYGHARDGAEVARVSGTFVVAEVGSDAYTFDVLVESRGGLDMDIDYSGRVDGTFDGPQVWNGRGTISRAGGAIHDGMVVATTVNQLRDNDVCPLEGLSGFTELVSEHRIAVIHYDGATDCDDDHSARWTLDGVDQGTVTGVTCSSGGGTSGLAALLLLLGLAYVRRR